MKYLYRGVSKFMFNQLNGKLQPKKVGERFSSVPCAGDPHAVCGSGIVAGNAPINSVVFHQWQQKGFPTSGVSSTPFEERAKFYALSGNKNPEGYIFTLSIEELIKSSVSIYRVNELVPHPSIEVDDEHILVARDYNEIPENAVVSVNMVQLGI